MNAHKALMAAALSHDLRPAPRAVNHLDETLRCLKERGYAHLQLLGSYPSYMTGLMFHKYEEKPEAHKVYLCLPEPHNPHDKQAVGVFSSRNKRMAFVPQVITEFWTLTFPGLYTGQCLAVAYCTGFCTQQSAQCLYNVYHVLDAPVFNQAMLQAHVPSRAMLAAPPTPPPPPALHAPCVLCNGPANRFILPCQHYACCTSCATVLYQQACPTCRLPVSGSIVL